MIQSCPVVGVKLDADGNIESAAELCESEWNKTHARVIDGLTRVYSIKTVGNGSTIVDKLTLATLSGINVISSESVVMRGDAKCWYKGVFKPHVLVSKFAFEIKNPS